MVRKNPKSCWSQLKCPRCALQQRIRGGGFAKLDDIDLSELFTCRASVMQSVPRFLWGSFQVALIVALDEIITGYESRSVLRQEREGGSCCCYCLACCCTDLVGEVLLIMEGNCCAQEAATASRRSRRRSNGQDCESRASRALKLVQLGELSVLIQLHAPHPHCQS